MQYRVMVHVGGLELKSTQEAEVQLVALGYRLEKL